VVRTVSNIVIDQSSQVVTVVLLKSAGVREKESKRKKAELGKQPNRGVIPVHEPESLPKSASSHRNGTSL